NIKLRTAATRAKREDFLQILKKDKVYKQEKPTIQEENQTQILKRGERMQKRHPWDLQIIKEKYKIR
ncbi:MAG: hypothetical protein AABX70_07400, partial [Nanoarchaeota archaeon]